MLLNRIKLAFKILWNLPKTVYFNFHYLPFSQAVKLPILLFNVKLIETKGTVVLSSDKVSFGMVRLGRTIIKPYLSQKGCFVWENRGKVIFGDDIAISRLSSLTIGTHGTLELKNNIIASSTLRIVCYDSITIGNNCRFAWEIIIMDTALHYVIDVETGAKSTPNAPIVIGDNNWIASRCMIMKGTQTPNFFIAGAMSMLNKKYDFPEYSFGAGNPLKLIKTGVYRDLNENPPA